MVLEQNGNTNRQGYVRVLFQLLHDVKMPKWARAGIHDFKMPNWLGETAAFIVNNLLIFTLRVLEYNLCLKRQRTNPTHPYLCCSKNDWVQTDWAKQ